ncbi:villin-1-like isoform X2 [Rhodnius prolixus]|uniref:villin-1-like isoform X2 n=1 Tax=Rhodnius prolixus TaxID=13249 RepID=UPI003D18872D
MKGSTKTSSDGGTAIDPAFRGISRTSTAFLMWRIENLQLVPVPKDEYGVFYDGDSYIVYAASEYGKHVGPSAKVREVHGRLEQHIHFWLGGSTSQDESAVAAYKSVELDEYLGGNPVQHRETRGNESPRFKAYFKQGLRILLGGVASGLKHINGTVESRLFRVKGRRSPVLTQMPSIAWEHFNSGDVFIIDTKDVVFVWSGKTANSMEKLQAAKVAVQFRDERNALSIVFVDDGKESELTGPEQTLLGYYLDLSPIAKRVMPENSGDDENAEGQIRSALKLYRCSDAEGVYKVVEVKSGALQQTDLDLKDSFIVDNGPFHIWVWIGRQASTKERVEAMRNAHGFLKKKNYPKDCRISRVVDGGEPIEFKVLFASWMEREKISTTVSKTNVNANNLKYIPTNMDSATLHNNPHLAAQEQLLDDGNGKLELWRVTSTSLQKMNSGKNLLYSAESYIIHYTYIHNDAEKRIVYYWKGEDKSEDAKTTLGLLTVSQESSLSNSSVQVRIVQGKEPPYFLSSFKGKLIIMSGNHTENLPRQFLLQVRGNHINNTIATQLPLKRSSLNSNFVFVLHTEENTYIWCGKGSTGDEREMAKNLAKTLTAGELIVLYEGLEKPDFWKILGNEGVYANMRSKKCVAKVSSTRLFHCSNKNGTLKVEEIMDFNQSDLVPEDVMILDVFHSLFLWIGKRAHREEKSKSLDFAFEYLETEK